MRYIVAYGVTGEDAPRGAQVIEHADALTAHRAAEELRAALPFPVVSIERADAPAIYQSPFVRRALARELPAKETGR